MELKFDAKFLPYNVNLGEEVKKIQVGTPHKKFWLVTVSLVRDGKLLPQNLVVKGSHNHSRAHCSLVIPVTRFFFTNKYHRRRGGETT